MVAWQLPKFWRQNVVQGDWYKLTDWLISNQSCLSCKAFPVKVNYNTIVHSPDEVAIGREGVEEDFKPLRYVVLYTTPSSLSLSHSVFRLRCCFACGGLPYSSLCRVVQSRYSIQRSQDVSRIRVSIPSVIAFINLDIDIDKPYRRCLYFNSWMNI